jgi:nicotinamidase-related amidase
MRHPNLLHNENALLLIIDVQERFRDHIHDFEGMVENIGKLIEASKILNLPVVITEQYPKGLGKSVPEIRQKLGPNQQFEKTEFSSCQNQDVMDALQKSGRHQIIVCGIEAHVCVNQTVHDLLASNYQVHVVVDAVSSRFFADKELGLAKMYAAGALPSCVEMALLELVADSAAQTFKPVQTLIK